MARLVPAPNLHPALWQNVERSIVYFEDADEIAIASDWFHARRASAHLQRLRPDLARRLVRARRPWVRGFWIQAGGAVYAAAVVARRLDQAVRQLVRR